MPLFPKNTPQSVFLLIMILNFQFIAHFQVLGTASDIETSSFPSTLGITIPVSDPTDSSSSSAGDFNKDGFEDLIIAMPRADCGTITVCGIVYVIFGTASGIPNVDTSTMTTSQGIKISGPNSGAQLGYSVSGVGDINKDSIDDIIIGAYGASKAYVIFGKINSQQTNIDLAITDISTTNQGIVLTGPTQLGYQVSSAGDFNKDGASDFMVSAPLASTDQGAVYIIFGKSSIAVTFNLNTISFTSFVGFKITGSAGYKLGQSLSLAGDFNDDGYSDIILGSPDVKCSGLSTTCGLVALVYGKASNTDFQIDNIFTLDRGFQIQGTSATIIGYKHSISSAGDINGDSTDDIVLGAPNSSSSRGMVYIIYGRWYYWSSYGNIDLSQSFSGFKIQGEQNGWKFGTSVASADINGDGYSDILVGSIGANFPSLTTSGIVYVFFGKSGGFSTINLATDQNEDLPQLLKIAGDTSGAQLGSVVRRAKDFNQNSVNDIVIQGGSKTYIIYGNTCPSVPQCNTAISPICYASRGCVCVMDYSKLYEDNECVAACSSDYYLDNFACKPCPIGCATCTDSSTCQTCESQYYFDTNNLCDLCPTGCATCTDSSTCQTCTSLYYHENMECKSCPSVCNSCTDPLNCQSCIQYYYLETGACKPCPVGCATCTSDTTCQTCKSGFRLDASGILCECNPGTYLSGTSCSNCPTGCATCTNASTCQSCKTGYYQVGVTCPACPTGCASCTDSSTCQSCKSTFTMSGSLCVCIQGTYLSGSSCSNCQTGCADCTSYSSCGSCKTGFTMNGSVCKCLDGTYLSGSTCTTCPIGCATCSSSSVCQTCNAGFIIQTTLCKCNQGTYLDGSTCTTCPTGCASCTNASTCQSCQSGFTLDPGDSLCKCNQGTYLDASTCSTCPTGCESCTSSTNCQTCKTGFIPNAIQLCECIEGSYLSGSACTDCPTGCESCTGPSNCQTCETGFTLDIDDLLCKCNQGTYLDTSTCETCPTGCESCTSSTSCQSCNSGFALAINGLCGCIEGSYLSGTICADCPVGCKSCTDSSHCQSCETGFALHAGDVLCKCNQGTYLDTSASSCQSCPTGCGTCTSSSDCQTCNTGFELQGTLCQCPDSTYLDHLTCTTCPITCSSCTSSTICQSCNSGFEMQGTFCDCPVGYLLDGSTCKVDETLSLNEIKSINSITDVAHTVDSAGLTAASALAPSDPGSVTAGMLAKMLQYIKYLNIPYSKRLELTFKDHNSTYGPYGIGPKMPEKLLLNAPVHPIPSRFVKFRVHSSFLVNFWDNLIFISILSGVLLFVVVVEWSVALIRKKPAPSILKLIRVTAQNFFLMQFYNVFGDVLLFLTLDLGNASFANAEAIMSLCFSIIFLSIGCIILGIHIYILIKFSTLRKNQTRPAKIEEFSKKWEGADVFFKHFKDNTFVSQCFLLFFVLRSCMFNLVIGLFPNSPVLQASLILTMSIFMLFYLVLQRSFKTIVNLAQHIVCEVIFLIVNACVLIMSRLDFAKEDSSNSRDRLCEVIIYSSLVFSFVPQVFLVIKIAVMIYDMYQKSRRKSLPKAKTNRKSDNELTSQRKSRNTLTTEFRQYRNNPLNDSSVDSTMLQNNSFFNLDLNTHSSPVIKAMKPRDTSMQRIESRLLDNSILQLQQPESMSPSMSKRAVSQSQLQHQANILDTTNPQLLEQRIVRNTRIDETKIANSFFINNRARERWTRKKTKHSVV